jgi:hypothetical protein
VTQSYKLRGKELLETSHKVTDVFSRVATMRPNQTLQPTPSRRNSFVSDDENTSTDSKVRPH